VFLNRGCRRLCARFSYALLLYLFWVLSSQAMPMGRRSIKQRPARPTTRAANTAAASTRVSSLEVSTLRLRGVRDLPVLGISGIYGSAVRARLGTIAQCGAGEVRKKLGTTPSPALKPRAVSGKVARGARGYPGSRSRHVRAAPFCNQQGLH
jgi:hypothetical protein